MKSLLCTVALALTMITVSQADEPKTGEGKALDKRVEMQHKKIDRMQEKGKISEEEAAALNQKVDGVAAKVEEAKKDGVTQEERKEIREELKATRQEIRKARKNKK